MLLLGSITATSFAQVLTTSNSTTIVDNDNDKDKKNKKAKTAKCDDKKDSKDAKSCNEKRSCCGHDIMKDSGCKDKKPGKGKK